MKETPATFVAPTAAHTSVNNAPAHRFSDTLRYAVDVTCVPPASASKPQRHVPSASMSTAVASTPVAAFASAELGHEAPSNFHANKFASAPRFTADVSSNHDLLRSEADRLIRMHKPSARFSTAMPKAASTVTALRADAPDLHPADALDALKPRAAAAVIAAPTTVDVPLPMLRPHTKPPPGPATYEPSLELVTRRTPGASIAPPPKPKPVHTPEARDASPAPEEPKARAPEESKARAPFNSSSSRRLMLAESAADERVPLAMTNPELVRRAAPAFSFGTGPAREGFVASELVVDDDAAYEAEAAFYSDDDEEEGPSYHLVERRPPAATFGTAPRWRDPASARPAAAATPDPTDETDQPSTPRKAEARTTRGGAIGTAARFPEERRPTCGAPFSPTASTVLSDAATDIATLDDIDGYVATRPRAPAAMMMPERKGLVTRARTRQQQLDARRGPGAYSVHTQAVDRRTPSAAFAPPASRPPSTVTPTTAEGGPPSTPVTETRARHRRRAPPPSPGPGAYAPSPAEHKPLRAPGAAWSKLTGREETRKRTSSDDTSEHAAPPPPPAVAATTAASRHKERVARGVAAFGSSVSARRTTQPPKPPTTDDVPYYPVSHALVEKSAKGGAWARSGTHALGSERASASDAPSSRRRLASRRIELLRSWRLKRERLEALLRGDFKAMSGVPGDSSVVRKSLVGGFRYHQPAVVEPPHRPTDPSVHPAVPNAMRRNPPPRAPERALPLIRPRSESYSFGKAAARIAWPRKSKEDLKAPGPAEYSAGAMEARLALAMWRAPAAMWSKLTQIRLIAPGESDDDSGSRERLDVASPSGVSGAAVRRRLKRLLASEGDVLTIQPEWSALYLRHMRDPSLYLPGFKMLVPTTRPRRALVPRPPFPPPPLAPLLLLPPNKQRHIPTAHLGPKLHRERPRDGEWGWGDSATCDVAYLSLADAAAAFSRLERATPGGTFSASARLEIVSAAAKLLPEGCMLELHPSYDLVRPHHGVLVLMGQSHYQRSPQPAPIELLYPGPQSYDASLALVKPSIPAVDFGRLTARPDACAVDPTTMLEPSAASYNTAAAWAAHVLGGRPPAFEFAHTPRWADAGDGYGTPNAPPAAGPLGEGEMLLLLEVGSGRATGRPMRADGHGGAIPMALQIGRAQMPREPAGGDASAPLAISAGDYDINDTPISYRFPVVDFGAGPARPALFGDPSALGDGYALDLDLEPSRVLVEHRAPAVDFARAPPRAAPGGELEALPEGHLLELDPQPFVVRPSHPTTVVMRPDPNEPREARRRRRWPVVVETPHDDAVLTDIERAMAAAGSPSVSTSTASRRW